MSKHLKKASIIIYLILASLLLTSCIGSRELNTLGIVIATGLDLEDGKIIITNEVINPTVKPETKDNSLQEETVFVQEKGNNIDDAMAKSTLNFDRESYYPHNYIIIFGEELAREGLGPYLDVLTRSNEQREMSYLLIAKDSKAYEIMGVNGGISDFPGEYLFRVIRGDMHNGMGRAITIAEFFRYYYRNKEGSVFGVAEAIKKPEINKSIKEEKKDAISIEGGAVLNDAKLVGYLTGEEMKGYNFIVNELKTSVIDFHTPNHLVESKDLISKTEQLSSIGVFKNKTKKRVELVDGKLHLYIDVDVRAPLKEDNQGLDLSKEKVRDAMEKASAREIKSIISKTMDKSQKELGVDIFGIGKLVHEKYPKYWKEIKDNWENIFMDMDYTVKVKVRFPDIGFTNAPPNIRRGK